MPVTRALRNSPPSMVEVHRSGAGSAPSQGSPRRSHSHSNAGTHNLTNGVGSGHASRVSSPHRRVSEDSNKRKRADAEYDSSASPGSRSSQRPRVDSQQSQSETLPPLTNGNTQGPLPLHHGPSHSHSSSGERFANANEQSFGGGRPSEGNSESETRLAEAFGKENQQQAPPAPMGTHLHSPPPKYPENLSQQQPLQGIQANLPTPLLQKQRKRWVTAERLF